MADILISALPEKTSADNTDYLAIDDGTTTYKISVEKYNKTGAASAAQSAEAAAQSAAEALASKNAAIQAKDDAQALITSAQTIVSNASDYANSAATSANSANDSANTATAKAAIATDAATQAAAYAANVDNFAKAAKSWAVGGTGTRSGEDTDNSKYYANEAHSSEMNAATSESAAASSETNAATSETNAAASESAAATSALNAATSETNASVSETNAAISEINASNSASSASSSETNAASFASSAEEYSEDSEAWAWGKRNGVDVPPTDPAYHNNAKYWADAASGAAGGGVTSFNTRSGAVIPAAGDYAANQISFSDSEFVATDVKAAIKEVQDNVDDLDSSLKTVAKSGSYDDLTNKPTLGTAAAKDSTNTITSGSTDLIEGGAVHTALAAKADTASLGTAASKNTTNTITQGGTDLIETGAVYTGLAAKANTADLGAVATSNSYNDLNNKPSIPTVAVDHSGSASASGVRSQRIGINGVYNVIDGTRYMEQTKTVSTSADTTYTFSNSAITASSAIKVFADRFGIAPSNMTISSGQCVVTIPKQSSAFSLAIRIYIM